MVFTEPNPILISHEQTIEHIKEVNEVININFKFYKEFFVPFNVERKTLFNMMQNRIGDFYNLFNFVFKISKIQEQKVFIASYKIKGHQEPETDIFMLKKNITNIYSFHTLITNELRNCLLLFNNLNISFQSALKFVNLRSLTEQWYLYLNAFYHFNIFCEKNNNFFFSLSGSKDDIEENIAGLKVYIFEKGILEDNKADSFDTLFSDWKKLNAFFAYYHELLSTKFAKFEELVNRGNDKLLATGDFYIEEIFAAHNEFINYCLLINGFFFDSPSPEMAYLVDYYNNLNILFDYANSKLDFSNEDFIVS